MPHWGLAPEACSPGCPASGQESSAGSWPFLLLLPSRTLLTAFISGTPHAPSTSDKVNGSEVGSNIGGWGRAGGSAEWKGKVKKNASRSQLRRSTWKGDDTLPHPRRPGSHRGCRTAPRNLSPSALEPPHLPPPTRPTPCAVTSRAGRGAEESGRCRCCFSGSGASAGNFPALRSKLSWSPPAAGWEGAQRGARGAGAARSPGTRPARRPAGAAAPPVCGPFPRARPSPQPPPPPRPRPAPPPPLRLPVFFSGASRPVARRRSLLFLRLCRPLSLLLSGLTSAGDSGASPGSGASPLAVTGVTLFPARFLRHLPLLAAARAQVPCPGVLETCEGHVSRLVDYHKHWLPHLRLSNALQISWEIRVLITYVSTVLFGNMCRDWKWPFATLETSQFSKASHFKTQQTRVRSL